MGDFLREYLERRRAEQSAADEGSETAELLNSLNSNIGLVANSTKSGKDTSKKILGAIDSQTAIARQRDVVYSRTSQEQLAVFKEVSDLQKAGTSKLSNHLLELNKSLTDTLSGQLAETNKTLAEIAKYLKPDTTHSKRHGYTKIEPKSGKPGKDKEGHDRKSSSIVDDVLDMFDWDSDGKKKKGKTGGKSSRGKGKMRYRKVMGQAAVEKMPKNASWWEKVKGKVGGATEEAGTKGKGFISKSGEALKNLWSKAPNVLQEGGEMLGNAAKAGKGMLGRAGEFGSKMLGKAGPVLGTAGKVLGSVAAPLAVLPAIMEGSKEDSTERYAKRFGTDTKDLGDGSFGSMAKFAALRAGGAATDIAQGLDISSLWNKEGDSWSDRLLADRRQDAGKSGNVLAGTGIDTALGATMAAVLSPFSKDARDSLKADFGPKVDELGKSLSKMGDDLEKNTTETLVGFSKSMTNLSDSFSKSIDDFGDGVKSTLGSVGNFASSAWQGAKDKASAMSNAVGETAGAVKRGWNERGLAGALDQGRQAITGQGNSREFTDANGNKEVREGGTRAWRNNNEGNMRFGEYAKSKGAIGQDKDGFAIFPDQKTGAKAKESLLFESKNYKDKGIDDAIARYAPSSENDTAAYQKKVREAAGVDGKTKMSDLTPEQRTKVLAAMKQQEGFKEGKSSYADAKGNAITADKMQVATAAQHGASEKKVDTNGKPIEVAAASTKPVASAPAAVAATKTAVQVAKADPAITDVRREPQRMVDKSAPVEAKPVAVANADQIAPKIEVASSQGANSGTSNTANTTIPSLDSMPLQITDLGLVLLNIGHV